MHALVIYYREQHLDLLVHHKCTDRGLSDEACDTFLSLSLDPSLSLRQTHTLTHSLTHLFPYSVTHTQSHIDTFTHYCVLSHFPSHLKPLAKIFFLFTSLCLNACYFFLVSLVLCTKSILSFFSILLLSLQLSTHPSVPSSVLPLLSFQTHSSETHCFLSLCHSHHSLTLWALNGSEAKRGVSGELVSSESSLNTVRRRSFRRL